MLSRNLLAAVFLVTISFSGSFAFSQENKTIDSLRQVIDQSGDDTTKINTLISLAGEYKGSGSNDMLSIILQALNLSRKIGYEQGMAYSLQGLADYNKQNDEYKQALKNYIIALALFKKLDAEPQMGSCYAEMGTIYRLLGEYSEAIENSLNAIKIFQRLKRSDKVAAAYNNIGVVYHYQSKREKALEYFEYALKIHQGNEDRLNAAKMLNNIAIILKYDEQFDKALDYYKQAANTWREVKDERSLAVTLHNLGGLYLLMKDMPNAYAYMDSSIVIREKIKDEKGMAEGYSQLGGYFMKKSDYNIAKKYIERSLAISEEKGLRKITLNDYLLLSNIFEKKKQYGKALECYKLYIAHKDTIEKDQTTNTIEQLQFELEAERKQQEVDELKNEKVLREAIVEKQQEKLQRQTIQIIAFLIGFVLVFILALVIWRSYRQKQKANTLLAEQKNEIEIKNRDITSSIVYAKRIQEAILPADDLVKEYLPDAMILYKPKDIVSGDFYWVEKKNGKALFASVDCTGHGVPGAFMSIVGQNGLNRAVNEYNLFKPSEILDHLNETVSETLHQQNNEESIRDGMDIALCSLDREGKLLQFAGAINPLYLVRDGVIMETKGDKFPIGLYASKPQLFTNHEIQLQQGDTIYLFSDGYVDQFGGPKGKKLKAGLFKEIILGIQELDMDEQKVQLEKAFNDWRGELEQIDDVCVVGIRI